MIDLENLESKRKPEKSETGLDIKGRRIIRPNFVLYKKFNVLI